MTAVEKGLWIATLVAFAWVCLRSACFAARYAMHTWWRTPEGRNLMFMSLCVYLIFGWLCLRPWLDIPTVAKLAFDLGITLMVALVVEGRHRMLTSADRDADEAALLMPDLEDE